MGETAFSAFVFGDYEQFIPLYCYGIHKNYPDSDILIFYHGRISEMTRIQIDPNWRLTLHEDFYLEYNDFKNYRLKGGGGLTCLRYLIPSHYFHHYDFVYHGDVDILILKESRSLFDLHRDQLKKNKLPFSNKVRTKQDGALSRRLTGLHCVETRPYYKKVDPIIESVLKDNSAREDFMRGITRDEELLYKLNMIAFEFDSSAVALNQRPWHGLHLGIGRIGNIQVSTIEGNSSLDMDNIRGQLQLMLEDSAFVSILKKIRRPDVISCLLFFELSLPVGLTFSFRWQLLRNQLLKRLLKPAKRIVRKLHLS